MTIRISQLYGALRGAYTPYFLVYKLCYKNNLHSLPIFLLRQLLLLF